MCSIGNTLVPKKSLSEGPQIVGSYSVFKASFLQFIYDPVLSVLFPQVFVFVSVHLKGIYCHFVQKAFEVKLKYKNKSSSFFYQHA